MVMLVLWTMACTPRGNADGIRFIKLALIKLDTGITLAIIFYHIFHATLIGQLPVNTQYLFFWMAPSLRSA